MSVHLLFIYFFIKFINLYLLFIYISRRRLQGIEPPEHRSEEDFDAASKYHTVADVPYIRYVLMQIKHLVSELIFICSSVFLTKQNILKFYFICLILNN